MRYSFTVAALAIGAMAAPQASYSAVQPISQISDGQIQAPPATSVVEVPTPTATVSASSVEVVVPTPTATITASSVEVVPTEVPTVVVPTGAPSVVPSGNGSTVVVPSSNATVSTGAPSSTGAEGTTTGPSAPAGTGAAAANMASFGALLFAAAGFVLA